jgi:hypothetical protein
MDSGFQAKLSILIPIPGWMHVTRRPLGARARTVVNKGARHTIDGSLDLLTF